MPQPRTRPRIWPWILGFLLVLMLAIGGCTAFVVNLARAPIEATNGFVALIDEGRFDAAYQSLCAEARAGVTLEQFEADHTAGPRITGYTFTSVAAETGGLTQVSGQISIDGTPRALSYGLREEDGAWTVCSYEPLGP